MSAERFDAYIGGGRVAGGVRDHPGCRDTTPPSASAPATIDGVVHFAGRSATWGGGLAFLDPDSPGRTPARAWRITLGQFADVWAQERRIAPGDLRVPLERALAHGRVVDGGDHYALLLAVGARDGEPMLTFTSPVRRRDAAAPSRAYRDTIAAGLVETHGWPLRRALAHVDGL